MPLINEVQVRIVVHEHQRVTPTKRTMWIATHFRAYQDQLSGLQLVHEQPH